MLKISGFSLIELLVALTVVSILAAIAYPSYSAHILKIHRTEAKTSLLTLANKLEQYQLVHHSYAGASLANLGFNTQDKMYYRFEIQSNENNYVIYAIPLQTQAKDTTCGTLSYNETGEKKFSGTGTLTECW